MFAANTPVSDEIDNNTNKSTWCLDSSSHELRVDRLKHNKRNKTKGVVGINGQTCRDEQMSLIPVNASVIPTK